MKVIYWSDYACPFCYIGETRLKRAAARLGISLDLEMKAFELNPEAGKAVESATDERFAKKYGLPLEVARRRIEQISQLGKSEGLDFRYAQARYTSTFDAHRLTKLARLLDPCLADSLSERLYRAYFSESLELADKDVLEKIAVEEGLDASLTRDLLNLGHYAEEVRLDEQEAQNRGVHAVPYFFVAGRIAIPGAMPIEHMEQVLRQARDAEEADAPVPPEALRCGPDGCRLR